MVDLEKMQRNVDRCLALLEEITVSRNSEAVAVQEDETPIGIDEAADFLNVSKQTLYQRVGSIPHHKRFGRLYFFRSELLEYLKGRQAA